MNPLQQAKYDSVIASIKPLMLEYGVTNLKISDIAKKIKIGEATIYRYFGTKTNLVIEVGVSFWQDVYNEIKELPKQETGFKSIEGFFQFFLDGYSSSKKIFIFLDEFDSLMVKESVNREKLLKYDEELSKLKKFFDELYNMGINDGSIKESVNRDDFYYTTTHMVLGICKRLASNGAILPSDDIVNAEVQVKMALDICLQFIKKESEK